LLKFFRKAFLPVNAFGARPDYCQIAAKSSGENVLGGQIVTFAQAE